MSREIRTLVFFDLEATSLIETNSKYPRIIELFMLAVGRAQFLTPEKPRVLNSLRLAFYPNKPISLNNSHITGLYNDALEDQETFDAEAIELINKFLSRLKKPVCLLAHNGCKFDFVLLQTELFRNGIRFMPDLLCADTLLAFQSLEQARYLETRYQASSLSKCALFQLHTPTKRPSNPVSAASSPVKLSKSLSLSHRRELATSSRTVRRKLWPNDTIIVQTTISANDPKEINVSTSVKSAALHNHETNQNSNLNQKQNGHHLENATEIKSSPNARSFKLVDIYKREFNHDKVDAHCAENDVMMLFDIAFKWNNDFLDWVDKYAIKFSDVSLV